MLGGVEYLGIDDTRQHIRGDGQNRLSEVDTVVLCARQEPRRDLAEGLIAAGEPPAPWWVAPTWPPN